jgi:hypothetical protein
MASLQPAFQRFFSHAGRDGGFEDEKFFRMDPKEVQKLAGKKKKK